MEFDTSETDDDEVEDDEEPEEDPDIGDTAEDIANRTIDLAYLRDLLNLLTEFNVGGFEIPGLSLALHERSDEARAVAAMTPSERAQDLSGTSNKPVAGFDPAKVSGFNNPTLWQSTNGKRLKLNGSLG